MGAREEVVGGRERRWFKAREKVGAGVGRRVVCLSSVKATRDAVSAVTPRRCFRCRSLGATLPEVPPAAQLQRQGEERGGRTLCRTRLSLGESSDNFLIIILFTIILL